MVIMEGECRCGNHLPTKLNSFMCHKQLYSSFLLLPLLSRSDDPVEQYLVKSVRQGKMAVVKQLINDIGIDKFSIMAEKLALIFDVITYNMYCIFHLLVSVGVNVDVVCKSRGFSPLHLVCLVNDEAWLKCLLKAGAFIDVMDVNGMTPLQYLINGDIFRRKYGLIGSNTSKSRVNEACEDSCLIALILEHGADLEIKNKNGETPLYESVIQRNFENAKLLLEHGAATNIINKFGETLLYQAVGSGNCNMIKLLLDHGADIKQRNIDGETLLLRPALKGNEDVVKLLLDYGSDVNEKSMNGNSLLHTLMDYEMFTHPSTAFLLKKVRNLLMDKGINVDNKDNEGATALHKAVESCRYKFTKMLLDYGADVNARTKHDVTPLHMAVCQYQNSQIVELLIKNHANVNAKDERGITPLHYLLLRSRPDISSVSLLLNHGADIFSKTNRGSYPFRLISNTTVYVLKARGINKQSLLTKMLSCAAKLASTNLPEFSNIDYAKLISDFKLEEKLKSAMYSFSVEIKLLKTSKIDHISYYDLLSADDELILRYLRNSIIEDVLSQGNHLHMFPLYGDFIQSKYEKAMKKKNLWDSGINFFRLLSIKLNYPYLPLECTEIILSFLNTHQLTNMLRIINGGRIS